MADLIDRQTIIETIHSAIYPYFCGAEDGDALSKDEKLVLSVNKAVCTAIKALPSAQPDLQPTCNQLATVCISRKAEIDAIKRYIRGFDAIDVNFLDGLKTAIQIIEQLPHEYSNAQNTLQRVGSVECEDVVSRQAAIDTIDEVTWYHQNKNGEMVAGAGTEHEAWYKADDIYKALKAVPSAERRGRWLEHNGYPGLAYLCSECNLFTTDRSFYCPHCGARMDGEHDE